MKIYFTFSIKAITIALLATVILFDSCKSSKNAGNSDTVKAKQNAIFKVNLKSNPSTGYVWFIANYDSTAIKLTDRIYTADPNPEKLAGVGGTDTWSFNALKKGNYTLEMVYKRPHENTGSEEKKISVKVK